MDAKKKKPETIAGYIKSAPKETQAKLIALHKCISATAPGAKESLKWGMPAYSYERILVMFAFFKNHISLFPTPPVLKAFAKQLSKYKTGANSIQFPLDQELPLSLISKITKLRVKDSLAADAKWRS